MTDTGRTVSVVRAHAVPLPEPEDPSFAAPLDGLGAARVVLLGEATHGTSEFYRARAAITRHLVARHGFAAVAIEGDWPDAAQVDVFVRGRAVDAAAGPAFARFPTWMWRNEEVAAFVGWLRRWNQQAAAPDREVGFHGLDLYSMGASIEAVLRYLDGADPGAAREARANYRCLMPWMRDPAGYGRAALSPGFATCEEKVLATLRELLDRRLELVGKDGTGFFDAAQNARLVANAERYYRVMYQGSRESWNLHDRHMFETLRLLLEAKPGTRAVVWAHNSHIGDARATEMGRSGELNLGQLCREAFGDEVRLVGFGTDRGTVAAADDWDEPVRIKRVRPSLPGSVERACHDTGLPRFHLPIAGAEEVRGALRRDLLERAIGVVYRPETERWSHYFDAAVGDQFDDYLWFDETRAVTPLPGPQAAGPEDTFPFGL
jgi:erythromycin esterase-like protein